MGKDTTHLQRQPNCIYWCGDGKGRSGTKGMQASVFYGNKMCMSKINITLTHI